MNAPLTIFDIDGTLCDTFNVDDECYCAALSQVLNIPVAPSFWEGAPHITDAGIADWLWRERLNRAPTADEIEALANAYEVALASELQVAPHRFSVIGGVPTLLEQLSSAGWDIAIATGGWSRLARLKLVAAHIPEGLLLASSDDSYDRLEIFRLAHYRAAKRRKNQYSRTVLVGDGTWDVRVAAAHGWCFLGVGKAERAERLLAEGASAVVEDFSDLPRVLDLLQHCSTPNLTDGRKLS